MENNVIEINFTIKISIINAFSIDTLGLAYAQHFYFRSDMNRVKILDYF